MNRTVRFTIAILFTLMITSACSNPTNPSKSVNISSVGWAIENISRDFWTSDPETTAFIDFFVKFDESNLLASDFRSVTITSPTGTVWYFDASRIDANYHPEEKMFGGWLRLFQDSEKNIIEIGTYSFEVVLTNGNSASTTLNVPAPGQSSQGTYNRAFTEDYINALDPPLGYKELPKRSRVNSAILDTTADTLVVDFSIDQSLIYSGYIWCFDSNGNYLGRSPEFRNFETGVVDTSLNLGTAFYTDGTGNSVTLTPTNFIPESTGVVSDIGQIRIVLTDGQQHAGTSRLYDTRSISQRYDVTSP